MSLLSSFDDVIMKVMCWRFLSFLGIDVFLLVNWVCKINRKQVTENNSKKLIIILQYKKIFQKINHFDHCIKIYRIFSFTRVTFIKKWWRQQLLTEITKTNFLIKLSHVNFRKSHEILDQFGKSVKSYIKMFEAAGLLGLPQSR